MAILKAKDILNMSEQEMEKKTKELKTELIKNKINAHKSGKIKVKEIKKTIARLLTFSKNKLENK